jgi:hypothetical protein
MLIYWQMYGSGACEAAMTQQIYGESSGPWNPSIRCFQWNVEWGTDTENLVVAEEIFALLKPHQSVWLIPGLFGAVGPTWPTPNVTAMAANDESLVEKLSAYFAWADTEPRITGVMPWHWYDLGAPYNGPPRFRLGADSFPKTLAWIAAKVAQLQPLN